MNDKFKELKRDYINKVLLDKNFRNKYAKSSAQNILAKINKEYEPDKDILINPNHLFMSAFYLLYSIVDIIEDGEENINAYIEELKIIASIFESLSNISNINYKYNTIEKGEALTLSSIAYNIAGYHANSHYLSKIAVKDCVLSPIYLALNLLVTRDFDTLVKFLRESKETDLLLIQVIFNNILAYIHFGDSNLLEITKKEINEYVKYFFNKGDIISWCALLLMKPLISRLNTNSIWSNIPVSNNIMWQEYVEALSFQKPPVTELWPSQVEALNSGLLDSNNDCIIKMPTSAGKTLIAELAILESLIKNENKKCIYISPYKSLATEVREKLEKSIGSLGYRISVMYGEYDVDGFEDEIIDENDVLVLTPEKLDLIVRENEGFAKQIGLIIIDEGHIISSGARGIRSEFLINRLRHLSRDIRVLFISAVFSEDDLDIMSKWLRDSIIANSRWKPTTLNQGFFNWRNNKAKEENVGIIQFLDLYEQKISPSFYAKVFTNKVLNQETNHINTYPRTLKGISASLAIYFQQIGQTIVFCARKKETEKIAEEVLMALNKYYSENNLNRISQESKELNYIIKYLLSYFDQNSLMIKALQKGIAFHHADLPDEVRQIIEKAFSEGEIRVLCCTTTLAQGVNLPANNVIIHSINHYRDQEKEINLTVKDYWNICGRAGRAYQSTQGNVIFVPKQMLFSRYNNPKNIETSISAFSSLLLNSEQYNKTMKDLLSQRFNVNNIYNSYEEQHEDNLDSLLSQLVALLCEEIVDNEDITHLISFFKESLLYYEVSKDEELIEDIAYNLFSYIKEISDKHSKEKLKLYYSTGLNIDSCETMEAEAIDLMQSIIEGEVSDKEILVKIIEVSFSTKEIAPLFEDISLKKSLNLADTIMEWINYSKLEKLKEYFIYENDMHFYNFINKTFIQKAPWGIHSFIRILESTFEKNGYQLSDYVSGYKYIASKVKYGVNDIPAVFICSLGIQNRTIAEKLARYYDAQKLPADYKTFKKWFCELINEDIMMIFDYSLDSYALRKITEIRNKTKYNNEILMLRKAGVKTVSANVVGMFFEDRYQYIYNLRKGEDLILKREIDNKFDPNAVAVITTDGNKIGYIERQYADYISSYLDRNYKYKCKISNIIKPKPPGSYGKIQVQIQLIR